MSVALAGCAHLRTSTNDSACSRDLTMVARAAQAAQQQLTGSVDAEQRQPTLARMTDAAARARASCGYRQPADTPSSDRARKPKAG